MDLLTSSSQATLSFLKYHALGNDFIVIDDRDEAFDPTEVQALCHRQMGVGADGILLLQESERADYRMRIYNADGTEPEMCGNGLLCFLHFLSEIGLGTGFSIETMHRVHQVSLYDGIELGKPVWHGDIIDTGVPHLVLWEDPKLFLQAKTLCQSRNANVNLVTQIGSHELGVKTYERGVGETLSCGTGAAAAAAVFWALGGEGKITVNRELTFEMKGESIWMQGPATLAFAGRF